MVRPTVTVTACGVAGLPWSREAGTPRRWHREGGNGNKREPPTHTCPATSVALLRVCHTPLNHCVAITSDEHTQTRTLCLLFVCRTGN